MNLLNITAMLSIEILVASGFDKVAGTAIYYLQYHYMYFLRIIGEVAGGSHGSNPRYPQATDACGQHCYWHSLLDRQPHCINDQ